MTGQLCTEHVFKQFYKLKTVILIFYFTIYIKYVYTETFKESLNMDPKFYIKWFSYLSNSFIC